MATVNGQEQVGIDFPKKVDYNNGMARPPKDPKLRMETDLRIPMTEDQKRIISEAVKDEPSGMAAWARDVLLQAAQAKLEGQSKKSKKKS